MKTHLCILALAVALVVAKEEPKKKEDTKKLKRGLAYNNFYNGFYTPSLYANQLHGLGNTIFYRNGLAGNGIIALGNGFNNIYTTGGISRIHGDALVGHYGSDGIVYGLNTDIHRTQGPHTVNVQTVKEQVRVPFPQPYPVPVTRTVGVPQPYPVKVDKPVPVPVEIRTPVEVPKPVPVHVPHPVPVPVHVNVPVPVAKPVPVPVERIVHVPVEHPVPVKVPQPVQVPVPQAVPVPVHKTVPVPVASPVVVRVPQVVGVKHTRVVTDHHPAGEFYGLNSGAVLPSGFGSGFVGVSNGGHIVGADLGSHTHLVSNQLGTGVLSDEGANSVTIETANSGLGHAHLTDFERFAHY